MSDSLEPAVLPPRSPKVRRPFLILAVVFGSLVVLGALVLMFGRTGSVWEAY
jgi:hypothetical protein